MGGSSLRWTRRAVRALAVGSLLALLGAGCGSGSLKDGGVGGRGGSAGGGAGGASSGGSGEAGSGQSGSVGGGGSGAVDGSVSADAGLDGGAVAPVPCVPSSTIAGDLDPVWSFALGVGGVGGMKLDGHGNLIVMGSTYVSTLTVGRQTLPVSPDRTNRAFVLSIDPSGKLLWSRLFPGDWGPGAFAFDGAGNIYLLGSQYVSATPADLGNGPISAPGVLAKLDAQGNTLWSHGLDDFLGPTIDELGQPALDVDPTTGQIAIAGLIYSSTGSYQPPFVAFYDGSGNYLSSLAPTSATTSMSIAVAFDGAGNLAVAGTTQPTPSQATPNPLPIQSAYVEKLDPTHAVRWSLALGDDTTVSELVAAGPRTFVSGTFGASLSLGGTTITSQGLGDAFIATIDDGATAPTTGLLARYPGYKNAITGLITDGHGGLWASGAIDTFVDFGTGMIAPTADVALHLDGTGRTVASGAFPAGAGAYSQRPVGTDAAGNLYFFGSFSNALDLGTGTLVDPSTSYPSLFLAKYGRTPATIQARSCPPPSGAVLTGGQSPAPAIMAIAGQTLAFTTGTETLTVPLGGGAPSVLAAAQKRTIGLAVAGSTVYWANAGSNAWEGPASNGSIVSAPLAGGTPTVLADGQNGPAGIAVDDTNVYWITSGPPAGSTATGAGVWAVPLGGGGTPRLLAAAVSPVGPIAAAGGMVVFAAGSKIMKVSSAGGDAAAIATTDRQVTGIALDGSAVYWTDADSQRTDRSSDDGRVHRATQDGASSSILASGQAAPGGLSLVAGTLTWCNAGGYQTSGTEYLAGVWSIPAAGGTPTALASGLVAAGPCAADGAHVAWVASDGKGNWKLSVHAR